MQYDINDMWNLGRDDRVISDNGKELRLPFLDTALVYAISYIPIYLKTDPGMRRPPGLKLLLRIYCSEILRLPGVAHRTKRDIYVGSGCYRICPDPRYITERSHSVREQESESG